MSHGDERCVVPLIRPPGRRQPSRLAAVLSLVTFLLLGFAMSAQAKPPTTEPPAGTSTTVNQPGGVDRSTVAPADRDRILPPRWRSSKDLAWTTSGDATGFHLLVAEASTGYTWRTVASLAEPGFETDRWIGNVCFTGSGNRAIVVYAPRQFTNRDDLFTRGGFAAIVDVRTGKVTKLAITASLAYYNPGCGTAETGVLTQSGYAQFGKTRLYVADAATGAIVRSHELPGQITSAVPTGDGIVAAGGHGLIEISPTGRQRTVATTAGAPFALHSGSNGVTFLEARGDTDAVVSTMEGGRVKELATGRLTGIGLASGTEGRVFITGTATATSALPSGVRLLPVPANAEISTHGDVSLTHVAVTGAQGQAITALTPVAPDAAQPVGLRMSVDRTKATVDFRVVPGQRAPATIAQGGVEGPAIKPAQPTAYGVTADYSGTTTDPDRTCAVARNDVASQVYQPSWTQVEWAADLAVQGALTVQRPGNWRYSQLAAWSPQAMFPRRGLVSGSQDRVPAPILLGVLAQESNLWQASNHILEGDAGNPLVGNFYGRARSSDGGADTWAIHWADADCGYGVAQVTDGMRQSDTSRTTAQKRAIALDYASNIAAGLQILEEKFNQTWSYNIKVNSGNPKWIESWFAALWAYNTGLQPRDAASGNPGCPPGPTCTDPDGNWGLGWANNPINPDYPANRPAFLDGNQYDQARYPQQWPYPEKVMGWAAYPIVKSDPWTGANYAGYKQAWWTDAYFRTQVKPPRSLFCNIGANHCDPSSANPCQLANFHCWWHETAIYKPSCLGQLPGSTTTQVSCGQESITFKPGDPEPAEKRDWYRPDCSLSGVPSGAYIIDDVPDYVPAIHDTTCSPKPYTSSGSIQFNFQSDNAGLYRSKVDFHQVGGGFGGHFWFASSQVLLGSEEFRVTGTWTLNRQLLDTWARVLVYIPDHGSRTQQAQYYVNLGDGSAPRLRVVNAKNYWQTKKGRWVPLGAFHFNGTPSVSLSNGIKDESGSKKIAWDAIAIQPLPSKPKNFVVSMGDSYSSGEGATNDLVTGADYFRETDADGDSVLEQNACHRSKLSWTRKATLKDMPEIPIGSRADTLDADLDFHEVACSGALSHNLLPYGETNAFGRTSTGQYSEVPQMSAGYLDENTTLVTFSIGGNDVRFSDVLQQCITSITDCQYTTLSGDTEPLAQAENRLIYDRYMPSLQKVIQRVHDLAPNAKIMVMGYPELISNGGTCLSPLTVHDPDTGLPIGTAGISPTETQWISSMAGTLAEAERSVAVTEWNLRYIPVKYIDPRQYFAGEGVCGDPHESIHGLVFSYTPGESPQVHLPENPWWRIGISQQSFHPNPDGTTDYANALITTLRLPEVDQ